MNILSRKNMKIKDDEMNKIVFITNAHQGQEGSLQKRIFRCGIVGFSKLSQNHLKEKWTTGYKFKEDIKNIKVQFRF